MNWKSIGEKIGAAAPSIGLLLGGPSGAAIGTLVASALGTDATPEAVERALVNDPAAMVKLKELQAKQQVELQTLLVAAEKHRLDAEAAQFAAEVQDRESARQFAATQPNDYVRPIIVFTLLLGAIAIVVLILSGSSYALLTDPTAALTVGTVIGFWFNELKQTLAFYFGTTKETTKQSHEMMAFAVAPGTVTDGTELRSKK